jgi:hypothetical protein
MEQAFLAIDRAPYTGHLHTCLLIVALDADVRDVVKMSHTSLAWQARISRRKAQAAFKVFEDAGLLTRFRFRHPRNPNAVWFQFHRDVLFTYPRGGPAARRGPLVTRRVPPARVCGLPRPRVEKRVKATIAAAASDSAERIERYRQLPEAQRLAFLRALRP